MNKIFKILSLFILFLQTTIYASNSDTQNVLIKLKQKIETIESIDKYKDENIHLKLIELKNEIKTLESKIEKQSLDKSSIDKDFEKFNIIIERQDKSIDWLSVIITFFGLLITGIIIFFSFRNEGVAKSVASEEIEKWLDKNADEKLGEIVDKYKNDLESHLNDAKNSVNSIKGKEKELHELFSNINNITDENIDVINEKAKNARKIKEDSRTESEWEELFLLAYLEQDYDIAIEYLEKIIEINPKNHKAYINMGIAYAEKGEYNKAIELFYKAIDINPKYYNAYYNIGVIYAKINNNEKAVELYKKVIEINPKEAKAYINLFECELVSEKVFDIDLENKFIENFKDDKNILIKYELLKILSDIKANQTIDLEKWQRNYKEQNLNDWSLDELIEWANKKDSPTKEKLLEAIEVFKSKATK